MRRKLKISSTLIYFNVRKERNLDRHPIFGYNNAEHS